MSNRYIQIASLLVLTLCQTGWSQEPIAPIHWTASTAGSAVTKAGDRVVVNIAADVQDGWHVYAFHQQPNGPTPLRVTLDPNTIAESAGAVGGTVSQKKYDESFNLDTQLFAHSFVLQVPVRVVRSSPLGEGPIPLSIRFQACDGRTCLPPRTIHIAATVRVAARK